MDTEADLLAAARRADRGAFDRLVRPYQSELRAHCYRMLGALHDAEDALQEALLGAWRGLAGFEGRSSVRAWLYRIATNACLRLIGQRPQRLLPRDRHPAADPDGELAAAVGGEAFVEPFPEDDGDPQRRFELRESVELAFVAALQHLPGTQRAVLILREVLAFSAAEVAEALDTSVASVNSALQRARRTVDRHAPSQSQQATLRSLGEETERTLVADFVAAWERADVPALLDLLAEDARFTMPPLPAWFDGRDDVARFLAGRVFATPWRLVPVRASGQLAFACYQRHPDGAYRIGCVNVLTLRGDRIAEITGFLDPAMYAGFGLPEVLP
ncbi:sigma-70 family RNA polymerase sigma factor [Amycolatopsis sp. cmx-4-68]|uniref:sigma-70 family RNA polymerase sigma factor n=1 Tax=Amycolatopsis sp. cmx-4-68 TaxID=2790938 RepID=UPI00397D7A27